MTTPSNEQPQPRIVLVGHCGPDQFMLKSAIGRFAPGVPIEIVNNQNDLLGRLDQDTVLLVNRELDGNFDTAGGIDLIRQLASSNPVPPKMLLVSNFDHAQAEAIEAGGMPGFGKSDLYDDVTGERIQAALS